MTESPSRTTTSSPPGGPPCRSRSSDSSDNGRTPSATVASASSARTSSRSCGSRALLRETCSDQLGVGDVLGGDLGGGRGRVGDLLVELVADVAHGADQRLVLGAELGAQPPHVDVDGAGAAEVVVAPDLLQQLGAGEDPAGVLGEVLEELELLVGQVQRPPAQLRGVAVLVDDQLAGLGHAAVAAVGGGGRGQPAGGGPLQPGVDLGGAGGVEHDVVD